MRKRFREVERACARLEAWGRGCEHQLAAVRNDRRGTFIVSGLLFTMTFATPTCRPHRALKIMQGNTLADAPLKPPSHSNCSSIARCFAVLSSVCWRDYCTAKRAAPAGC